MAVELTLLAPLLILLLLLCVVAGRLVTARMTVETAAREAARAATTTRTPTDALHAATVTADAALGPSAACRTHQITVDTSRFIAGGFVAVTVSCHTDLSGMTGLDLPGQKTITARFVSPLDTYRSVTPGEVGP